MDAMRVKGGSKLHEEIAGMAKRLNEAIPDGAQGSIVLSALFFLIRIGMRNIDEQKRIEAFDTYAAGVRTDILSDMEGSGSIN